MSHSLQFSTSQSWLHIRGNWGTLNMQMFGFHHQNGELTIIACVWPKQWNYSSSPGVLTPARLKIMVVAALFIRLPLKKDLEAY